MSAGGAGGGCRRQCPRVAAARCRPADSQLAAHCGGLVRTALPRTAASPWAVAWGDETGSVDPGHKAASPGPPAAPQHRPPPPAPARPPPLADPFSLSAASCGQTRLLIRC